MQTVFVLGAGFSRAISDSMPLTDELGNLVRDRVPEARARAPHGFKGGYFEAWLSRLAEPQPDLQDHVNQTNFGLFLRITDEIQAIMQEREFEALKTEPHWWLHRLIGLMHVTRSPVITFNYDTLVERTVLHVPLGAWPKGNRVSVVRVILDMPPSYHVGGWIVPDTSAESFRLLKLHGSLEYYWTPGDASGATISRWDLEKLGTWGNPQMLDEQERRQKLPGRSPFIVPPAAAKSVFYNNPVSRELWRSAAEALGEADRVALVGYSLPPTDLVTSGMLVDTLIDRDVQVDVVNRYPDEIAERLIRLGVPKANVRTVGGVDAVADYTDELEREVGSRITDLLEGADPSRLMMVGAFGSCAARATGLERRSDGVYVQIEPVTDVDTTTRVQHDVAQPTLSGEALCAALRPGDLVRVQYPNGEMATIVAVGEWNTDIGLGDGHWTILVPSAIRPYRG